MGPLQKRYFGSVPPHGESLGARCFPVLMRALRDRIVMLADPDGELLSWTDAPAEDLAVSLGALESERDIVVGYINDLLNLGLLEWDKDGDENRSLRASSRCL